MLRLFGYGKKKKKEARAETQLDKSTARSDSSLSRPQVPASKIWKEKLHPVSNNLVKDEQLMVGRKMNYGRREMVARRCALLCETNSPSASKVFSHEFDEDYFTNDRSASVAQQKTDMSELASGKQRKTPTSQPRGYLEDFKDDVKVQQNSVERKGKLTEGSDSCSSLINDSFDEIPELDAEGHSLSVDVAGLHRVVESADLESENKNSRVNQKTRN